MKMTVIEKGEKSPAELVDARHPGKPCRTKKVNRYPVVSDAERERRIRRLRLAIAKAGNKALLGEALGVGGQTIGRWDHGEANIHDAPLAKIEAFLAEGQGEGLRRGHGVEWCAEGAHYVPEGQMRVNDNGTTTRLAACRDCQTHTDRSSRAVQAELEGKS